MTTDPFAHLTTAERLAKWREGIESGAAPDVTIYTHGLASGEAGIDATVAMPKGMSEELQAAWERCYQRGQKMRYPVTAKQSANPNRVKDEPSPQLRRWEKDNDLIG